jgi:hypothetical protein
MYDMGEYRYEFSLARQGNTLFPVTLTVVGKKTITYTYPQQEGAVWVPEHSPTFQEFIEGVKAEARRERVSEETLNALDDPNQYKQFQKPMFLPEGMAATKFLQALPTQVGFLQYLLYEGRGPMYTDKETIESMPLMLMFLVDAARLSSVGMIASAQCTVRGEPTTVCNYYVLGPGGFKLTDKEGFQAAVDAYREKRI